jgi:hypothetical protein
MTRFTLDDILGGLCMAVMILGAPYWLAVLVAVFG